MEDPKRAAAERAVELYVESGMVVGLGTGSTAAWVVRVIGELVSGGALRDVTGVPTSDETARMARDSGIPLASLASATPEVTLDGADEISSDLALIKGLGGALLREKIVAHASGGLVIVADSSKKVTNLGSGLLPVETEPFGWQSTLRALESLGCTAQLRMEGDEPFITDGAHYTMDCDFPSIPDPAPLETEMKSVPGALENGLVVGMTSAAVISWKGGVEVLEA
jgi:ribose 5-phosphate isomerase A